jgi:hypothetical protein
MPASWCRTAVSSLLRETRSPRQTLGRTFCGRCRRSSGRGRLCRVRTCRCRRGRSVRNERHRRAESPSGYSAARGILTALGEDRLCLIEGALSDQWLVCGDEVLIAPADAACASEDNGLPQTGDVSVGVDVAGDLDRGVTEQLLDGLQAAGGVEDALRARFANWCGNARRRAELARRLFRADASSAYQACKNRIRTGWSITEEHLEPPST